MTPTTPQPTETEIGFDADGVELTGTLIPPSLTATPMALLVSGSGPIDRDSNTKRLPVDVMRQVAGHLAETGVGTYRYDKRGIGDSGGSYHAAGLHDNVADADAAIDMLRQHPSTGDRPLIVIGHSEGALIALHLAASDLTIDGIVLLAGSAQPGGDVLRWQGQQLTRSMPRPLRALVLRFQQRQIHKLASTTTDTTGPFFARTNAKWHREFIASDPARLLPQVTVPVLAITGDKDIQVDPDDVARMGELVAGPFTGANPSDVTHLLRADPGPPSVRTYKRQAERPLSPVVLELISRWTTTLISTGLDQEPAS